jgi:hypothetical protein
MLDSPNFTRRKLLGASAATGLAGAGAFLSMSALAQDKVKVNMQLGWIAGGNQIGEVVAKQLGYYATEGIDFAIQPGGPSIDGVAIVASGRWEVGQVSSSPSNMLAVSQDLPIKVLCDRRCSSTPTPSSRSRRTRSARPRTWSARRSASSPPAWSCCARCWPRTRSTRNR